MLSNKKVITMIIPPKFNSLQIEADLNQKKSVYDKRAHFVNVVNLTDLRQFNVVVYIVLIGNQYH